MWNHGSSNSRGVAILFSKTIDYEVTETGRDNTGRKIFCVANVKHLLFGLRALQTSIKSFLSIYFFNSVEPMSSRFGIGLFHFHQQ
jgi:hypothetical protein